MKTAGWVRQALGAPCGVGVACAALLLGCAAPSATPPAAAPVPTPSIPAAATAPAGRDAFERVTLQRAIDAERQGRWAEAAWAWDVLTVWDPERRDWLDQQARVRQLVASRAAAAFAAAQAERQRGDLERATRSYLLVLSLTPEHAQAADALRSIERERNERQYLGRFSRQTITRSGPTAVETRAAAEPSITPDARNLSEHAALLAAQGELDAAIVLLAGPAGRRDATLALKRQLADLYFKRAERLPANAAPQTIAALREALRWDPSHEAAAAKLKSLAASSR